METGRIIQTAHYHPFGTVERYTYQWEGGDRVIVSDAVLARLDRSWRLEHGQVITVGPWRLRVIDRWPQIRGWYCIYETRWGWLWQAAYWGIRWGELVYRRMVLTLAVWGLADYRANYPPSWRDVGALRWLADRLRGWRNKVTT